MAGTDDPILDCATVADWAAWLAAEHATSSGIRLRIAKKGSGATSVTSAEALQEALRYGWIDGLARRVDDVHYLQRYTPRRTGSRWSKVNCGYAEALIAAGRMEPAGLREVARAKADGRWAAAYDPPSTATVPPDLQREFDANASAAAFFATLDGRNRYAVLHRIQDAKQPATRARRIAKFVAMLAAGEKIYP